MTRTILPLMTKTITYCIGYKLQQLQLQLLRSISVGTFLDFFFLKLLHPNFIHLFKKQSFIFKNSVTNFEKAVALGDIRT